MNILETDSHFLASNHIIDYSLILGEVRVSSQEKLREFIEENPTFGQNLYIASSGMVYTMGIIDPLTNFNAKKNLEYMFKRCRYGHRMSCVPPDRYANRFMDFMKEIFVEEKVARTSPN